MHDVKVEKDQATVMVEKAKLPLNKGESIEEFRDLLCSELRVKYGSGTGESRTYVYPMEVYAEKAIIEILPPINSNSKIKFLSVPYKRQGDSFVFGSATEVKRKTTYVPKVQISKSLRDDMVTVFGAIVEKMGPEKKAESEEPVKKSLWEGVI